MATYRVRHDRDLEQVIVEPVGGVPVHLDASGLDDGDFDVFLDQVGNHSLVGGKGRNKVAAGRIVRAAPIPNPAVTGSDLTGKDRKDTPVIGSDTIPSGGSTQTPDAVLKKAAVGQTPNVADGGGDPKSENLGPGAGQ